MITFCKNIKVQWYSEYSSKIHHSEMFSEEQKIFFPPIENNLIYLYIM